LAADDPVRWRIMAQALRVIDTLVSGEASEYRLRQQSNRRVWAVLAVRASEVTTEPQNSSINRWSKSSLSAPPDDSPSGPP
jgi:hypothetical protein